VIRVVLASGSATRRTLLENAGVACTVVPPRVSEDAIKANLRDTGPAQIAETLAEAKALDVARRAPDALVIGADQVLDCGGVRLDKPNDRAEALDQLKTLRGRAHDLVTAACVAEQSAIVWRHTNRITLHMRPASDAFLDSYLDRLGERALAGPGAYQLEGPGAQLFERVDGDFFSVLGLPLLPLLGFLRRRGALAS
jgi:septum formation protein